MKLKYVLPQSSKALIKLETGEDIRYCAPYDLVLDNSKACMNYATDGYVVVTQKRLFVLSSKQIIHEFLLKECEKIRCESQVNNGLLTVKSKGKDFCIARFSMRHVSRFSYIARGADLFAHNSKKEVTNDEPEKYCPKCEKALPGTQECPSCGGRMVTLRKFTRLCSAYKGRLFFISLFMVMASALNLITPEVQKNFIDGVLRDRTGEFADVFRFIGIMLALTLSVISINIIRNWWCVSLGARISMDLRKLLYHKVQLLSLSFLQKRKPGELMNRIANDTTQIRNFMQDVFGNMLSTLFTMVGSFIIMYIMNPKLTLMSIALIVAVIVITKVFWKKIHRMFHTQWVKSDKINSRLQDVISGMRVVKSFGKETEESARFQSLTNEFADVQKHNEAFFATFYPILTFIMGVGVYFATYFGGINVLNGIMTPGELIQFITYTNILYGPLGWMTNLPRSIVNMLTSMERIYDVLDEAPEIKNAENSKELVVQGNVEFENISFGYKSYEPVIEEVSLSVKKGEMIGLVGASGTGKSTIINLIMRLYDVDEGSISIDGVDIKEIKQESLHSQIGVVLQETFLFSGTILNNIRFAKQDATFEEVVRAAKAANAHDFICKSPDGYNTYVGEHGHNLSGGERQRIAIARAILNNPKLLILDEATSALDTESEYLIQQALDRLTEGRTTFAIAHRLSTLRNATRLVVIDGHKIAEVGTHNELLEKKGIYYGLVTAQMQMQGETKGRTA